MRVILLLIALLAAGNAEASFACERKVDLCVFLDGSSTICNGTEACAEWNSTLQFSKDLVSSFKIGQNDTEVALVTFGDKFNKKWNLNKYTDKISLLSAIEKVEYPTGEFTYLGLPSSTGLFTGIYNPAVGDRANAANVIVLPTDGTPKVADEIVELFATLYQSPGIIVFMVCVEPRCTERYAQRLASPPKQANVTYFLVDDYFSLTSILENLVEQICVYPDPPLTAVASGK